MRHIPYILGLILFGAVVYGYGSWARDLWAPDEPRFGQVMREMIERRDPFVLFLNGKPYSDKPPLYVWMAAGLTLVTGHEDSEVSSLLVRAPSVFGGIVGLLATYILGRLLFGTRRVGLYSSLIAGTMLMYVWQSGRAQLDMLMSGWSYLAVLFFWLAYQDEDHRPSLGWWCLFWIAGGLATLSKGPPGLLVPLGTAAFFLMWQNNPRLALNTALAWTASIFFLTALAWFEFMRGMPILIAAGAVVLVLLGWAGRVWLLPLSRANAKKTVFQVVGFVFGLLLCLGIVGIWFIPYTIMAPPEASSDTLVHQTLSRYLAGESHVEVPWYYVTRLPHNLFPWTLLAALAIFFAWKPYGGMPREPRRFITTWGLFALTFFSLSPGKRDQYLLPSIPAYALFCGWLFDRFERMPKGTYRRALSIPAYVNGVLAALLGLAAIGLDLLVVRSLPLLAPLRARLFEAVDLNGLDVARLNLWPFAAFCLIVATFHFIVARRKSAMGLFIGGVLLASGANVYANGWVLPSINGLKSGRMFTQRLAEFRTDPKQPIGTYNGVFREEYILYGDYFAMEIESDDEGRALKGFLDRAQRAFVLMREKDYRKARSRFPELPMRVLFEQKIGSRELVLIDNRLQGEAPVSQAETSGASPPTPSGR
ncbi:glycosyltransferase family 39 protein [Candidatus Sumerlaeota bacterium]|nr:glycosyltransferase family 39 protein [Candidatus Sumerlaeota bacterium]